MIRFSFSSLRVRLLLLVLIANLPALGLMLYSALEQRQAAAVEVQETALRLARLASSDQGRLIAGARQLLIVLAELSEVQRGSPQCNGLFSKLLQQYPLYANLGVAARNGDIFCSALPQSRVFSAADRSWFQRAIQTKDFAIGDYQIGRITGKPTVNFGYPILDDRGRIKAVVFSALDLAWLNHLAAEAQLPEGSTFTVTDQNGVILAHYPESERWVGKSLPASSALEAMLTQRVGVAEAASLEGVPSLFGFTPFVGSKEGGDVYVSIGIPKEAAFAEVNRMLARNLFGLGLVSLLALVVAWVGSDLFVLRRIDAILRATKRLATGDLTARAGPSYGEGELGILSQTFDEMAGSLQAYTTQLEYQATHDALTGLPNGALLGDRLRQAVRHGERERKPQALLVIDLDRFKEINNTLGHSQGDVILREVGRRIRDMLRKSDTVARVVGDKYAALLPETGIEGAVVIAKKILKGLETPFSIEGLALDVEASIGIVVYPDHGEEADLLIQRGDVAMYQAKEAPNGYAVYASERDQHSPRRLTLMGELRHAIETGQMTLYYQPKLSLQTRRISGVEALVRWRHPERGVIPPAEFIVPAERTGLIRPLTLWVIQAALLQCRSWRKEGIEFPVSVNLSARNLFDPQLPDQVGNLLRTHGVPACGIEMEITESAIMADPARAMEILSRLRAMGIALSIDDFGTGYSSLGYLKKLRVDELKIDKSFVGDMVSDENDAMIVRSIIDLGHNLGLKVVAEGVEDEETWNRLAHLGCDTIQGYYISRPIPAEELIRWLRETAPKKGWGIGKPAATKEMS